ncbi:MAG: lamin tail domain-containing protein, partial [Anaerolineae bacterium]|nr:lamin tail domain-containing protein [Anaerolineae bacterium]
SPTPTATPLGTPTPTATAPPSPTATPTATATPSPTLPPSHPLLISEVLYDGTEPGEGDEFVEIWNPLAEPVDLGGYKVGDEERRVPLMALEGEGMYAFPEGLLLGPGEVVVVARDAAAFQARFGRWPDFQFLGTAPEVPRLARYTAWSTGSWALTNGGDEVLLLGPGDDLVDAVAYREGDLGGLGLVGSMAAPAPRSMQRVGTADSGDLCDDFVARSPNPGEVTWPPEPPATPPPPVHVSGQYYAFVGDLHAYTAFSGGAGPPAYAFAQARANGLHFLALADHAHDLTPDRWKSLRRAARQSSEDGAFVALRGFAFVHPWGTFTVLGTSDYVAAGDLPADTLRPFYQWLVERPGAVAQFVRPVSGRFGGFAYDAAADGRLQLVELGSGVGSGYHTAEKAYKEALAAGWRVGPTNNSHTFSAAWGADTRHRTGILAPELKANALLRALRRRRTFATEDANLVLAMRCNGRWMGSRVAAVGNLRFVVTFHDPDAEVVDLVLYEGDAPVAQKRFADQAAGTWRVRLPAEPGRVYWVKAVQLDGDTAYTSPLWTR